MYQKSGMGLTLLLPKPWTNWRVTVDLHTHTHSLSRTHACTHTHSLGMVSGGGEVLEIFISRWPQSGFISNWAEILVVLGYKVL